MRPLTILAPFSGVSHVIAETNADGGTLSLCIRHEDWRLWRHLYVYTTQAPQLRQLDNVLLGAIGDGYDIGWSSIHVASPLVLARKKEHYNSVIIDNELFHRVDS